MRRLRKVCRFTEMVRDLHAADLIMTDLLRCSATVGIMFSTNKKKDLHCTYWGMMLVGSWVKDIGIRMHVVYNRLYC